MSLLKNPVILALDVDDREEAVQLVLPLASTLGAIKIGPRLINKYGMTLVQELAKLAPVFIDNKYFDIPSTMLAAVKQCFDAGATLVTVHALSGSEALSQLAQLEKELNKTRPFKILAVTILTSWDHQSFPKNFQSMNINQHVRILSELAKQSGINGLVCSAHELSLLKDLDMYKVAPGIRLDSALKNSNEDQKRTMSPQEAIQAGASALVIGRPILSAPNPKETIQNILKSIS